MQGRLDKGTHNSLGRQLRRYRWILLLLTATLVYSGYRIYEKGPDRWTADTFESFQQGWERVEAAFTPDYSTAGEGAYFVVKVVDGDTMHVRDGKGTVKVRLHGIDTPERGQPYGRVAGRALADMVAAEYVRLKEVETDRYGRTVAKVYIGDTYVNKALVEQGYAWWYRQYAQGELRLWLAEREARKAKRGLWAEPNPTPPWEWRRNHR